MQVETIFAAANAQEAVCHVYRAAGQPAVEGEAAAAHGVQASLGAADGRLWATALMKTPSGGANADYPWFDAASLRAGFSSAFSGRNSPSMVAPWCISRTS